MTQIPLAPVIELAPISDAVVSAPVPMMDRRFQRLEVCDPSRMIRKSGSRSFEKIMPHKILKRERVDPKRLRSEAIVR